MKTTFLLGAVMAVAMNLVACTDILGCDSSSDAFVDSKVAPLTFVPVTTTATCEGRNGVLVDLTDANGFEIQMTAQSSLHPEESRPLTENAPSDTGHIIALSSADSAVKVTLTNADGAYGEDGLSSASATVDTTALATTGSMTAELHVYFSDGRALDVVINPSLQTACPIPATPTN